MDVICDRCSTEYEFDEAMVALVSARGTTVKCTHCGHLFKIFRAEHEHAGLNAAAPGGPQSGHCWTVRRVDGSLHQLGSLGEVTRLISDGRFTRDDEVSRTGKVWRRLGNVEELEPYFIDADRRGPSRARDLRELGETRDANDSGLQFAVPAMSVRSNEPNEREDTVTSKHDGAQLQALARAEHTVTKHTVTELTIQDDEVKTAQRALPPARERRMTNPHGMPAMGEPPPPAAWPPGARNHGDPARPGSAIERMRLQPTAAQRVMQTPEPVTFPVREVGMPTERPRLRLGLLVLLVAGVTLGAIALLYAPPSAAPTETASQAAQEDPTPQFSQRAAQALAAHRPESFMEALKEYSKALVFHDDDPHILSSISRVHALWAQEIKFAADAASGASDGDRRNDTAMPFNSLRMQADQALHYATLAVKSQPSSAEAQVALIDALRLSADLIGARNALGHIDATVINASAENLRVAALLAGDEACDLRAARATAQQAVTVEPLLLRTNFLLARCAIAAGDLDAARQLLREVAKREPDHPGIRALEDLIKRSEEPPSKVAAPENNGTQLENLSHESYISRGQAALEAGQVSAARRSFEQALYVKPNSAQAHAGLGYVALEKNRPSLAVEHFIAAMRYGNEDALIGLGEAFRRTGRNREALRAYQNYLSRKPAGREDNLSVARAQVSRLSAELGNSDKTP